MADTTKRRKRRAVVGTAKTAVDAVTDEIKTAVEENETDADLSSAKGTSRLSVADVELEGVADIQFNRFTGADMNDKPPPEELMYLNDDNELYLPSGNLLGFFYSETYSSCVNLFTQVKQRRTMRQYAKALIHVNPTRLPILRDGEPIRFNGFDKKGVDRGSGIYVHHDVARVKGAAANPQRRPTLPKPWAIRFELEVYEMDGTGIKMSKVQKWLTDGGLCIGVATHRPMFGRFRVARFVLRD